MNITLRSLLLALIWIVEACGQMPGGKEYNKMEKRQMAAERDADHNENALHDLARAFANATTKDGDLRFTLSSVDSKYTCEDLEAKTVVDDPQSAKLKELDVVICQRPLKPWAVVIK